MTRHEKVAFLKKQIHKDHCVIRFWKNHDDLRNVHRYVANQQIHWAHTSLKIATKNLTRLSNLYHSGSSSSVTGTVPHLICQVFGPAQCANALRVAYRESRFYIWAKNGQYLGIFQMGSVERARFATIGYSTAYQQIVAAHNYFLVSGWSPWSATY